MALRLQMWSSALALVASGCTELAPGSDRLESEDARLTATEGEDPLTGDPRWSCLVTDVPAGAVALRPEVTLSLAVVDTALGGPPAQLSVLACNRLDVECATPLAGPVGLSADGLVHLSLPQGFVGFLQMTSPAMVPTLFFISRPLQTDRQESFSVINPVALGALAMSGGVSLDSAMGHLYLRAFDCDDALAAGVELSNDAGGVPFVFIDGLPDLGGTVTAAAGSGGFVNVPPGPVVLQGREVGSGRITATTSVLVRSGWFTYGNLTPSAD